MVGLSWVQALEYCEEQVELPIVRVFIFLVSKDGFLAEPKTAEQFEFVSSLARVLGGVLERGSCLVDWAC